jgi:hypothetical protein
MLSRRARTSLLVVLAGWASAVGIGVLQIRAYENTSGAPSRAPVAWPVKTSVPLSDGVPTLILFVHPHCPCSRASIAELAQLMTDCGGNVSAIVLMLQPAGVDRDWVRTGLWESASAIPGVRVECDVDGVESRRFGTATSGQAHLYSSEGRLLFAGGITASRGHRGENVGRTAITSLVLDDRKVRHIAATPVYGCPLFNKSCPQVAEGASVCPGK